MDYFSLSAHSGHIISSKSSKSHLQTYIIPLPSQNLHFFTSPLGYEK